MRNLEGKYFNLANRNFAIKTNMYCLTFQSPDFRWFRSHWLSFARIGSVSLTLAPYRSHWLSFRTAQRGLVCLLFLYLYSINSAICRPSDRTAGRPRAEIRTRDGRETLTTKYDCISFNHTVWSVSGLLHWCAWACPAQLTCCRQGWEFALWFFVWIAGFFLQKRANRSCAQKSEKSDPLILL